MGLCERLNDFGAYLEKLEASKAATADFKAAAEGERFARKHVELTRAYWAAESRCASSFICGPANFPIARNRKRMDTAAKRGAEISDHVARSKNAAKRRAFPHGAPGKAIRSNNPDALALLAQKRANLIAERDALKTANAVLRKAERSGADEAEMAAAVAAAMGWKQSTARTFITPNYMGKRGAEGFRFQSLGAEIRRIDKRIDAISAQVDRGEVEKTKETAAGDVRIVEDPEAGRIQLFFPDKPDEATRSLLKSRGFRWAPSAGAWQRHLNQNGRCAVEHVMKALGDALCTGRAA
ncbi:hypothetical protein L0F51_00095 [Afifella sp. H1R]|uniref:hypothetical protein n=1 Tax=Afifella sp. H1R TaxID=2908841 RepID=UPI001F30C524|nr:hypothetical protein [Afifella sp. H1R]MCF1502166.1 hypothetical protein [Afifella sp. H1R]